MFFCFMLFGGSNYPQEKHEWFASREEKTKQDLKDNGDLSMPISAYINTKLMNSNWARERIDRRFELPNLSAKASLGSITQTVDKDNNN